MEFVLLLTAVALTSIFSIFILSFFSIKQKTLYILAFYVISAAKIIFILELCGAFGVLDAKNVFVCHVFLTVMAVMTWKKLGTPPLLTFPLDFKISPCFPKFTPAP